MFCICDILCYVMLCRGMSCYSIDLKFGTCNVLPKELLVCRNHQYLTTIAIQTERFV